MNKVIIGQLPDGTSKTIDLEAIHTLLIAGEDIETREQILEGILIQVDIDNTKLIDCIERRDNSVKINSEDYKTLSQWCRDIKNEGTNEPTVYVIDDYAEYIYSEGIVSKADKSQFKKDVLSLAQEVRSRNSCLILVCSRPCVDALTMDLKHHFQHRILSKTNNRVDSYSVLDMPTAVTIKESQLVYSDGGTVSIINFDLVIYH